MSNAGQAILTIVGTVVGAYFGYPQLGFLLGSYAGNALFPTQLPTVRGPKLDDLTVQVSAVGMPVPLVYGSFRVAGNIIWSTDLIPTTTTEHAGGKGGPSQKIETTTYAVNFAVGLCEGTIVGIRRIWAGGKLIYDRRPQLPDESTTTYLNRQAAANSFDVHMTIYLGDEAQLPDPTIESYEGVGNVPGYRGLAYVVLDDFQLADYGNNLAATALSFEVIKGGGIGFETLTECQPSYIAEWLTSVDNPFNPDNDHSLYAVISRYDADGSPHVFLATTPADVTAAEALSDLANKTDVSSNLNPLAPNWPGFFALCAYADKNNIYSTTNSTTRFSAGGYDELDNAYRVTTFFFPLSEGQLGGRFYELASLSGGTLAAKLASTGAAPGEAVYIEYPGAGVAGDGPPPCSLYYNAGTGTIVGVDPVWNWDGGTHPGSPLIEYDGANFWYGLEPIAVTAVRIPRRPSPKCDPRVPPHIDPPDAPFPGFCNVDGIYYEEGVDWDDNFDVGNAKILQTYNTRVDYRQQVEPFLISTDPNYSNQTFWEAAYGVAEAAGLMPSGLTYPADYPVEGYWDAFSAPAQFYCLTTDLSFIDDETIRLMDIVRDLCLRSGLTEGTDFNVDQLTQIVYGYAISNFSDAVTNIQPLRLYGFFDMVESDGVMKFVVRGGDLVDTVVASELAAHESSAQRPSAVVIDRTQDVELPRVMRVKYLMYDKDYEPGEQVASRLNTTANQIVDMAIPVAMPDILAKQIADVSLYEAWLNRNTYTFQLGLSNMAIEATDPIEIPVDGSNQRVRILSEDFSLPSVKQMKAIRDGGVSAYTSYIVEGGVPLVPGGTITIKDSTVLFALNLPMLRDADADAGYYVGLRQANNDGTWPGASFLRSADAGASYSAPATATRQLVTGFIVSIEDVTGNTFPYMPSGVTETIDDFFEIVVELDLDKDELVSTTLDGIQAGNNAFIIGADGRWEVCQFLTAEPEPTSTNSNAFRISGLTRARRGTDYVMNADPPTTLVGDRFILLGHVVHATQDVAEIGASRLVKGVTAGTDSNAVSPVNFTGTGEALRPFGPVNIVGERDLSDNITITWDRRSRFGQELPSGTDIPLGEATEAYELEIIDLDEVTVLRTITGLTSPTYVYSAADQTTDYGSPQSAIFVDVYQMSAVVGRGHPGRGRNV